MKPLFYKFRCGCCNYSFKAPELPGELFGEFIMRSNKTGEAVYLNSFEDKVFDELESLFKNNEVIKNNHRLYDAEIFQSIFSISCDSASDGSQYQIGLPPVCPNCGSKNMLGWEPTDPPEFVEEDIKSVTHECWNTLTNDEKITLVNKAIMAYLKKNVE